MDVFNTIGTFVVEQVRNNVIISRQVVRNTIVDVGKNSLLDTMFDDTAKATWYSGLISSLTTLSVADTMASHTGWIEFTNYDEAVRQEWVVEAARTVQKSIRNDADHLMTFTINDSTSPVLKGIMIADSSTKSGTTGTLWSTAPLTTNITLDNDDVIRIKYIVTIN